MTGSIGIILIFICEGYLLSRLTEEAKSKLSHIVLFSLGTMGIISFLNFAIWDYLSLYDIAILSLPIITATAITILYNQRPLSAPIDFDKIDFIILAVLLLLFLEQKYGFWDAWMMWNTKAKFLTFDSWRLIFSSKISWMHTDYPLLLPSIVASGWLIADNYSPYVPIVVALLFTWSACLLLKDYIYKLTNKNWGVAGILVLLSLPAFIFWSRSQYADVPLSAYLLLGIILLFEAKDFLSFFMSGIALSFAVFTKNEGIFYLILILISFVYSFWRIHKKLVLKNLVSFISGVAPGIILSAYIKKQSLQSEYLADLKSKVLLINFERVFLVLKGFGEEFLNWYKWIIFWPAIFLLLILLSYSEKKRDHRFMEIFLNLFISLSLITYFIIYLLTPYDVAWQINNSFDRFLVQILPLIIILLSIKLKNQDAQT